MIKNKDLQPKKHLIINPPVINYSEFSKTKEEKESLKITKKAWIKRMREKHLNFEKRKWGNNHTIWTQ